MRLVIFPRGRTYFAASDRLGRAIVEPLMMPSATRDRLAWGIYRTVEPGNPVGLLQEALELSVATEPLEKRIRVEGVKTGLITALDLPGQIEQALAAGLINAAEAAQLREFDRKVMDIINRSKIERSGLAANEEALKAMSDGLRQRLDKESSVLFGTARLWDDGIIDPRDTRGVLTQVLQLFRRADGLQLRPLTFGVARP